MSTNREKYSQLSYAMKKCPECLTQLPLDVEICSYCKQKLGEVDKYGRAKKPIDWKAYTLCVISWAVLGVYVWWAFLR